METDYIYEEHPARGVCVKDDLK